MYTIDWPSVSVSDQSNKQSTVLKAPQSHVLTIVEQIKLWTFWSCCCDSWNIQKLTFHLEWLLCENKKDSLIKEIFLWSKVNSSVIKSQFEIFQACVDLDHSWWIVSASTCALVWLISPLIDSFYQMQMSLLPQSYLHWQLKG